MHEGEKIHDCTLNLQPSDLLSNAYRSLPGNQDGFFHVLVSTGILESNLLSFKYPCET